MKGKYNGNCEQFGFTTTIPNEASDYIDVNEIPTCKMCEKQEQIANVSVEEYNKIVRENEILKNIIIELNKQIYQQNNLVESKNYK